MIWNRENKKTNVLGFYGFQMIYFFWIFDLTSAKVDKEQEGTYAIFYGSCIFTMVLIFKAKNYVFVIDNCSTLFMIASL